MKQIIYFSKLSNPVSRINNFVKEIKSKFIDIPNADRLKTFERIVIDYYIIASPSFEDYIARERKKKNKDGKINDRIWKSRTNYW